MINHLTLRNSVPFMILLIGAAILASVYVIDYQALNRNQRMLAAEQVRTSATYTAAELEAAFRESNQADARAAIDRSISDRRTRLVLLEAPNGVIRYASEQRYVGKRLEEIDAASSLLDAFGGRETRLEGLVLQRQEVGVVVGRFPVQMRGLEQDFLPDEFGHLYVIYDMSRETERQHQDLMERMLPRSLFLVIMSLIVWIIFRRFLLGRIEELMLSVRAVGKGDFSREPNVGGNDEIADLSAEVTSMMRNLRSQTEEITYLADHDQLTGLLNRRGFESEIKRALRYLRFANTRHAVCLLDIDSLRVVNDTRGHIIGDELLFAFGEMLGKNLEQAVAIARVGGDEFAVLMEIDDEHQLKNLATHIQTTIQAFRFTSKGDRFSVQVSMGAVMLDESIANAEEALSCADTACYAAKETGHGKFAIWEPKNTEWSNKHGQMRWVSRIQHALDEGRFRLYAQTIEPLVLRAGRGLHLEILVRMVDEHGSILPPGDFLGAAERYNLVGQIDRWVINETLRWLEDNPGSREMIDLIAINLSGLSFGDESLLEEISRSFARSRSVRPGKVCFEVTETSAITNLGHAREFIETLRAMGCQFALDDFGSGVSSFGYLKNLPVDFIKIDGMFVRDICNDSADRAIVSSINSIAHEMGKRTIAEFAENRDIINLLAEIGVDYAQGYGISKPEPLDDVAGPEVIHRLRRN